MKIGRGGVGRFMHWFLAGTVLILLILLCGWYISRTTGNIIESDYKNIMCAGDQWPVEAIQDRAHLAESVGTPGSWPNVWGSTGAINGPNPAHRRHNAAKTSYEEHQYLARYDNKESGQQTPEEPGVLASGEATAGAGGTAQRGETVRGGGTSGAGGTETESSQDLATSAEDTIPGYQGPDQSLETITGTLECLIIGNTYVLEQLVDYDFLIKYFYNVHTSTAVGCDLMSAKDLLSRDVTMKGDDSEPQIPIYHTHSRGAYKDSGPGQTVVGMGDYLTRLPEAKGYNVYHDTSVHDLKNDQLDRNKACSYALGGATNILQRSPSIEVVLDIHRDGVGENLYLVTQVSGRDTAQITFFNGLSRTPKGPIEYPQNPYWGDNLVFNPQVQLGATAYYSGFTRKIYLKSLRYNEHLRPRSSSIGVGAQTNTYEEVLNAMEPLSELLDMVLQENRGDSIIW